MNKKNTKMLSGALAATTVLTSAAPVFAKGTDWNKVYENAYKAMQKAEKDKTQESINAARKAIAELSKNKELMSLVGTLSEHVDGVQQGLFNDFYALMYVEGKEKPRMSQKEINQAREYVNSFATCDVNKQYTQSWSTAVDKFQQNNVNEMVAAVKKAQETKDAKDVEAAKALVAELETSTNKDVLNATAAEKTKVEAVEKEIATDAKLAVEKFEITNLRKAVVTFNKELNKETVTTDNIRLYDGSTRISGLEVVLGKDNKSVYILNKGAHTYAQLKEYKVVVENVATLDGKKIERTEATAKAIDNVFPTVESMTVTSPKTIAIKFSEPVSDFPEAAGVTEKVQIDGINAYIASVDKTKMDAENTVIVTLGNALKVGEHSVKITGLHDYATLPLETTATKINVVEDKTMPEVTKVVANRGKVTVTFNKPVENVEVANLHVFEGENKEVHFTVEPSEDHMKFELKINAGEELGLASLVQAKLTYKNIQDNYGNKVEAEKTVNFTAEDDKVKPEVESTKVNLNNSVEVIFSEEVQALTKDNFELYNKEGKKVENGVTGVATKVENGKTVATLTLNDADNLSGEYTVKALKTIKDNSVRQNTLSETKKVVVLNDKVAPKVTNAIFVNEEGTKDFNDDGDVKDSKVTIFFDKAMNVSTLMDKSNYILNNKSLADVEGVTLAVANDNKSVTITINKETKDAQVKFDNATDLRLIAIKDTVGNNVTRVNEKLVLTGFKANETFENMISKAELVSKNEVKIYAQEKQTIKTLDPNGLSFTANGAQVVGLQVMSVKIDAKGETAILTLNKQVAADCKSGDHAISLKVAEKALTNTAGVTNDASAHDMAIADTVKASLAENNAVVVEKNKVTLTFDETLKAVDSNELKAAIAQSLVVKDSQGKRLAYNEYSVAIAGKTLVLTINKADFNDKISIELANNVAIFGEDKLAVNDFKVTTKEEVKKPSTGVAVQAINVTAEGVNKVDAVAAKLEVGAENLAENDTLTITNGDKSQVFKKASAKSGNDFTTVQELVEAINAKTGELGVTAQATDSNKKVLLTASTTGVAGNSITVAQTGGHFVVAGGKLTGGIDKVDAVAEVATLKVLSGAKADATLVVKTANPVAEVEVEVKKDDTAAQVADKIQKALNGHVNGYTVTVADDTITFTAQAAESKDNITVTITDK